MEKLDKTLSDVEANCKLVNKRHMTKEKCLEKLGKTLSDAVKKRKKSPNRVSVISGKNQLRLKSCAE